MVLSGTLSTSQLSGVALGDKGNYLSDWGVGGSACVQDGRDECMNDGLSRKQRLITEWIEH